MFGIQLTALLVSNMKIITYAIRFLSQMLSAEKRTPVLKNNDAFPKASENII